MRLLIAIKRSYERDLRGRGKYQDDGQSREYEVSRPRVEIVYCTGSGCFLTQDSAAYAFVDSLFLSFQLVALHDERKRDGTSETADKEREVPPKRKNDEEE